LAAWVRRLLPQTKKDEISSILIHARVRSYSAFALMLLKTVVLEISIDKAAQQA
jgi:hypothetical protein